MPSIATLRKSRAATERFRSSEAAVAAGYARVTDYVEHQPDGAMAITSRTTRCSTRNSRWSVRRVLVYERKADGGFKLNGVEHLVPISAWTAPEPPRIMRPGIEAGRQSGHLVSPRLDLGAQPERGSSRTGTLG